MKYRVSSKFSLIGLCTAGFAALERLKKIPIDFQWEKFYENSSAFIFNWILFILAGS